MISHQIGSKKDCKSLCRKGRNGAYSIVFRFASRVQIRIIVLRSYERPRIKIEDKKVYAKYSSRIPFLVYDSTDEDFFISNLFHFWLLYGSFL